ncbi:hypothetical protein HID58_071124 [Brassica napus]|uniref:Uncharacterized protein n=1 Tax=Brassica napus TaxID=3708 RepID=A0ABQ7Z0P0_BRANA|nr:hypothetical protein HID58_071124 [Brassica napus]
MCLGSCSRRVSEHLVVLREALLQIGVGVVVYGGFKATLLILATGFSFWQQRLSYLRGISQRREQDEFMVVSSHIVFAGIGMLLESTSSGRWSGGIGVLRGYEFQGDHRELATPEATWEFPASMAMRRTSRYHGHCVR